MLINKHEGGMNKCVRTKLQVPNHSKIKKEKDSKSLRTINLFLS